MERTNNMTMEETLKDIIVRIEILKAGLGK